MRPSYLCVTVLALVAHSSAQINLDSLVSEAYSVYTEITSIWESDANAATATTSSTGSFITSASPASSTLAKAQNSVSPTASSAATSLTSSASSGHGTNHQLLAIILGTILGAIVLALLVLLLLICCRRRRRSRSSGSRVLSPSDESVEQWRHQHTGDTGVAGPERNLLGHNNTIGAGAFVGPQMAEHPAYRNQNQENPFVPTPPPARRTAPNSRAGLTDEAVPGDEPYVTDPITGRPVSSKVGSKISSDGSLTGLHKDHHKGEVAAAGLAGAALAGAAMHHHHKSEDERFSPDDYRQESRFSSLDHAHHSGPLLSSATHRPGLHEMEAIGGAGLAGEAMHHHRQNEKSNLGHDHERDLLRGNSFTRRPVNPSPLSPISPVTEHDDHNSFRPYPTTTSNDDAYALNKVPSRRSGESARRASQSRERNALAGNDNYSVPYSSTKSHEPLLAGAAGVGAGALAGAAVAHHHRDRKSSKSRSRERRRSLGLGKHDSSMSDNSNTSTSNTNSGSYEDALPVQPRLLNQQRPLSGAETRDMAAEMPADVPPTPPTRSRRSSSLGTGAPSAALGSYQAQSTPLSQHRDEDIPPVPPVTAQGWGNGYAHGERQRRDQTPPAVPSRSPRRARFGDVPFDHAGEPVLSPSAGRRSGDGGIVGDNRYPHMGVPSRRSGDDFEHVVPVKNEGPAPGMQPPAKLTALRDIGPSSEDSTWRLSSGMPGGWQKDRLSSITRDGDRQSGFFGRDSGVSGMGSGSRSGSMTSMSGNGPGGNGRRLRLADLKREEEEREMALRGRKSIEGEWSGRPGEPYDGYDYHAGGVGRAL